MLREVRIDPRSLDRFEPIVGANQIDRIRKRARELRDKLAGRTIWTLNSTSAGGGVSEMLRSLVPYSRDLGIETRWLVVEGSPAFYEVTKGLHNALHGIGRSAAPLDDAARREYETVIDANARGLLGVVRRGDLVILHDPQTAGLIPHLARLGAVVVWRCHIGGDTSHPEVSRAWRFLAPYLADADAFVFSRQEFVPEICDPDRTVIVHPSIDPFSAKNQALDEQTVRSILVHTGLVGGLNGHAPSFVRADGSPGQVVRRADVKRVGEPPAWTTPLVVQVSRWDRLKDPIGVLSGFARTVNGNASAELVLAGPSVEGVTDDPEGADVYYSTVEAWRNLPEKVRHRVHLATLPMDDVDENAVIVNALQRHAAIVVQKSLQEGFGLTVTEAMWKSRPVVASAVGGIREQIDHDVHGLLLQDPTDLDAFASTLVRALGDPDLRARLQERARQRVEDRFLGLRTLGQYSRLIDRLIS